VTGLGNSNDGGKGTPGAPQPMKQAVASTNIRI